MLKRKPKHTITKAIDLIVFIFQVLYIIHVLIRFTVLKLLQFYERAVADRAYLAQFLLPG